MDARQLEAAVFTSLLIGKRVIINGQENYRGQGDVVADVEMAAGDTHPTLIMGNDARVVLDPAEVETIRIMWEPESTEGFTSLPGLFRMPGGEGR